VGIWKEMKWIPSDKEKGVVVLISLAIVVLVAALMYFQPPFIHHWIIKVESDTYDRQVRRFHRSLPPHPSIAIIDIDDRSLAEEGRWPWNREKIAKLALELHRLGASVIAFDMVFSEPQENPVDAVLRAAPSLAPELDPLKLKLDSDLIFAAALQEGVYTLAFAFASNGKEEGMLPSPILELSESSLERTLIPHMNGHIGNLPLFQEAVKQGGFINTMIDADGILRFSPLLMREKEKVYPALALQAAQTFLKAPFSGVVASNAGENQVVHGIRLGELMIPTDPWGRILIPYRGLPFSFPYFSATDVLHGKIDPEQVRGKLIFIGTSATSSSDLLTTAISPAFPGVEVQATIASGIIDNYLPYKPNWGRGMAIAIVLLIGGLAAITFPYISRSAAFLISIFIIGVMEGVNYWLWTRYAIVLSFFFPMPTLVTIFLLDLMSVYISDIQQKKEIKKIFGQYVPTDFLDRMLKEKGSFTLAGETKELSFLFADIWEFPGVTLSFNSEQMKEYLTRYFTQMSEVVFNEKGVLDKYVRDQISAFWGAPFDEPKQAYLAVKTALEMQEKIGQLVPKVQMGIGINTGQAHVGDMGSKYTRSYTAIGASVDLAHHIKTLTKTYSVPILVGEETWKLTKDQFNYRKVEQIEFRGKLVDLYEPTSIIKG